ncbi:hypothetical protein BGZ73_002656 [Actinomortierella ambigua]|nr:hypothetical protein BGZ73_002656 [Actinomortierella ambigua]
MDLAEGGSLQQVIREKQLDWATKTRITNEIARGLEYMHTNNVIHRDLKSLNVLLTKHMKVKLCDFGLAEIKTASLSKAGQSAQGTLRWMAPELLVSKPKYTTKSDIFALGIVMWEMAANCTPPFKDQLEDTVIMVLVKAGEREDIPDNTPSAYQAMIKRCWHKDSKERPEASEILLSVDDHGEVPAQGTYLKPRDDFLNAEGSDSGSRLRNGTDVFTVSTIIVPAAIVAQQQSSSSGGESSKAASPDAHDSGFAASCDYQDSIIAMQPYPNDHDARVDLENLIQKARGSGIDAQLIDSASKGDATAQIALGDKYRDGEGAPRDDQAALGWYRQAAKQENPIGEVRLGEMYMYGQGVPHDYLQSYNWFHQSANRGCIRAQREMADFHHNGRGVPKDHGKAMFWYRKAADQGDAGSQCKIGTLYEYGQGVPADPVMAAHWYMKAADQGHAFAKKCLKALRGRGMPDR